VEYDVLTVRCEHDLETQFVLALLTLPYRRSVRGEIPQAAKTTAALWLKSQVFDSLVLQYILNSDAHCLVSTSPRLGRHAEKQAGRQVVAQECAYLSLTRLW
jgi:hypothetical protein